jgi:hypothetical protein
MKEVVIAPRSPWQNAHVERLTGSIRRECLDHVVVLNQRHLRRLLKRYFAYYHSSRTHLSLAKDAPEPRSIQRQGKIVATPQVGCLHHRYERRADTPRRVSTEHNRFADPSDSSLSRLGRN